MSQPVLLLGRADDTVLLESNRGYTDDSVGYEASGITNRAAPAGIGGECIFTNLYFTTRHYSTAVLVRVGIILDGVELPATTIALADGADAGTVREHEVSLLLPFYQGGVEVSRYAPRGTRVEVYARMVGVLGPVDIGGVEIEYEVVRETRSNVP